MSAGSKHPSHLMQRHFNVLQPWQHAHSYDKAKCLVRKIEVMNVTKIAPNSAVHG
jgi:hypothetical protein